MQIKKLSSSSIGTHYPQQVIIFSDKGEIFVTKDELTPEGYELLRFQTFDTEQLVSLVNNLLRGVSLARKANVKLENSSIAVSPVANLYAVESDLTNDILQNIVGGYDSQVITIISKIDSLEINNQGNIQIDQSFILSNAYSILLLQKYGEEWIEISCNINQ